MLLVLILCASVIFVSFMRYDRGMEPDMQPAPGIKLCSATEDKPREVRGSLIPRRGCGMPKATAASTNVTARSTTKQRFSPEEPLKKGRVRQVRRTATTVAAALLFMLLAGTSYGLITRVTQIANPTITVVDAVTNAASRVEYGVVPALSNEHFFAETRNAFIDEKQTFVEVDLAAQQLRYFKHGVLLQSSPILEVAEIGSWWDVPSGLYTLERKDEEVFSELAQATFPWQLTFERNFVIHGWPRYTDDSPVMSEFRGGGIRLSDEGAKMLFDELRVGATILVRQAERAPIKQFIYEPRVPHMGSTHYFAADLENGTVLAASDLDDIVPIASLTKLMTAVVAAEQLDLDGRVYINSPTFVHSLIPRLSEGSSVSVYSLLQLLLVESSNEAAETIAGEMGRDAFIEAMNIKARQLSMFHSNFADPSGLSAENTSTVEDLYRLLSYIYNDRRFILEITKTQEVPTAYIGGEFGRLSNFNLVKGVDGFIGGKVGETRAAGQTSITLHELTFGDEDRLVAIILLGSEQRSVDVRKLIDYLKERYR
jgi:D-alanyl-D-alanine endopeptidase (penicillin-binding protein 7)